MFNIYSDSEKTEKLPEDFSKSAPDTLTPFSLHEITFMKSRNNFTAFCLHRATF